MINPFQNNGNTIAQEYPDVPEILSKEIIPITEALWNVEIKDNSRKASPFYWYATTNDNIGMGNEMLQFENSTSHDEAVSDWEAFAKVNGVKKFNYIKIK